MNAENPVQTDLFGVSATRTKDTRLAEHIGGSRLPVSALQLPLGVTGRCGEVPLLLA
jgi:hypothetical protein